ncbi:MAG: hypothetical protein WB523_04110 [Candidatus Sulfotelmatobacter sp.]
MPEQAHELSTDSHANFVRGLIYGMAAAIAGLILYATFEIMTGLIIGYFSLAVGWMVGKAMMKGSNGQGGTPLPDYCHVACLCRRIHGGDSDLDSLRRRT